MAETKKSGDQDTAGTEKASTSADIVKSQAQYEGKEHSDLVEVTIIKDGDFYKEGDVDQVHPTTAHILEEKGLIKKGSAKKVTRPDFQQKDVTVDV